MNSSLIRFILYILLYFVLKEILDWIPAELRDIVFILFGIGYFIWVIVDIYKVKIKKKNTKNIQIVIADVISLATFCMLIYLTVVLNNDFSVKIFKLITVSYLLFTFSIIIRAILNKNSS